MSRSTPLDGAAQAASRSSPVADRLTVIVPARGWVALDLGELWAQRELLGFLTWRDIKVRYKQTVLGVLWAVLQPIAAMCVFTIFFHRVGGIAPEGDLPYPLWSYAGLLPWTLFAQAVTRAAGSLVTNTELVTKVHFPRLTMPLAATLSAGVDFVLAFAVYLGLMVYYGRLPGPEVLLLPLLLLLLVVTALGVGLWLAAVNVRYRDVRHAVPFLVQMWLFVSPVVYPSSAVGTTYRDLYGLNPMVGVIDGFRWCMLGAGSPPGLSFWISVAVSVIVLVSGAYYFKRMEASFADVV